MPRAQRDIPAAAKTWGLRSHTIVVRTEKDTRRKYKAHATKDVLGEPDEDGELVKRWPAAEFSPRVVLERWGAGRYTVDWYDKSGKKCGEHKFTVDEPAAPARGRVAEAAAAADDEDADIGAAALRLPKTPIEWMMWQQREERAADRRRREELRDERDRMRQESDERATRDREFLSTITQSLAGREVAAAGAASGLSPEVLSRELGMMRRELLLAQREQAIALRAELLNELPEEPDGAENFSQAFNQTAVAAVEGVGEQVPEIIGGLLGKLRTYLQLNGQPAEPKDMVKLIEAARIAVEQQAMAEAAANGAGN
jgi:hypothetical protein